jgi:hypothetical protein
MGPLTVSIERGNLAVDIDLRSRPRHPGTGFPPGPKENKSYGAGLAPIRSALTFPWANPCSPMS